MIAFRLLFQIPHERKMKQKIFLPIRSTALWQKGRQKMKTLPSYLYSNINWLNFTVTDNQKHCVHTTAWKKGHSFLARGFVKIFLHQRKYSSGDFWNRISHSKSLFETQGGVVLALFQNPWGYLYFASQVVWVINFHWINLNYASSDARKTWRDGDAICQILPSLVTSIKVSL